jgi:predicted nucleic acid-binding protein
VIIADTSLWVQHFRRGLPAFAVALSNGLIAMHPVVLGELATGNLAKRAQTLASLRRLPLTKVGTVDECLDFIEMNSLYGRGVGWNDLQLLVAARLSGDRLWSLDIRLSTAAEELRVAYHGS